MHKRLGKTVEVARCVNHLARLLHWDGQPDAAEVTDATSCHRRAKPKIAVAHGIGDYIDDVLDEDGRVLKNSQETTITPRCGRNCNSVRRNCKKRRITTP